MREDFTNSSTFLETYFPNNRLRSLEIKDGVTELGDNLFYGATDLDTVSLPESLTTIGVGTFGLSSVLKSIIIPDSVKTIGDRAFYSCASLGEVVLGKGLNTLGTDVFSGGTQLHSHRQHV